MTKRITRLPLVIIRNIHRKLAKYKLMRHPIVVSDEEFLRVFNCRCLSQIPLRLNKIFFFDPREESLIEDLRRLLPLSKASTIEEANKICNHIFDLLGSGQAYLGPKINWQEDFKAKKTWPLIYRRDLRYFNWRKKDFSDVKVPWELSRFQHLVTLGKAYRYTNDEKYVQEFMSEVNDWIKTNPVEFGVNWITTMEVAIRAVNWIWTYNFFARSPKVTQSFKIRLLKSLFLHGRFITNNLEWGRVRGNHYLSDVVGLIYLGLFFKETKEGKIWLKEGITRLIQEMDHQVYPDGVDHEASISYHRLVTELFLSATLLLQTNSIKLPDQFMKKLEKMIEFIMYYTKPDGLAPVIGDADDGRLHILSKKEINDHRYLLSIGAVLFGREDFKACASIFNEDLFWLTGLDGLHRFTEIKGVRFEPKSRAFRDGGFFVMRDREHYMIIRCGEIGLGGMGGHSHCDTLSFELAINGRTFIVDPGAYVYTASPTWRNIFRSTSYHNTIMIDDAEMNRFNKQRLFSMQNDAIGKINRWLTNEEFDFFDGEHWGYKRLKDPVIHRRQIFFNKGDKFWIVRDILSAKSRHKYDMFLHFNPMKITRDKPLTIKTKNKNKPNMAVIQLEREDLSLSILSGWVSSSYGKKSKAPVARYTKSTTGDTYFLTIFYPFSGKVNISEITENVSRFLKQTEKLWH